ncbi:hypothetical protein QV65_23495 [Rhodococcus erythropolis]|nr:hypothetical protein QV65_23495 [Rhodococcus erythropolis]
MADIATAVGINRSNFYFYFESKYEVLGDLVADVWSIWIERTGGVPRRAHESIEIYHDRLINAAYSTWVDHDVILIAGMQAVGIDADIRRRWLALLARIPANTHIKSKSTRRQAWLRPLPTITWDWPLFSTTCG